MFGSVKVGPDAIATVDRRATPAPQVMLLSVWLAAGGDWHARVMLPDAQQREFTSPFDLAQFLSQLPRALLRPPSGMTGLR